MKEICTTDEHSNHKEVADIFRCYGEEYRSQNGMTKKQHEVMYAIEHCRTSHYGYHVDKCDACGHIEDDFNSCRDRHCPKCQGINRRKWVEARLEDILPVPYYHAVFTLPHLLNALISYNRALIYDLLFSTAAETLLTFGRDPKWLGGELGFYGILHSWGQSMWPHLHVHFIVPGGALSDDDRWLTPRYQSKFLFPVRALSKVFRGKFIEGLKTAYADKKIVFPDDLSHLREKFHFERWIDDLVCRNWIVYCKTPFRDAEQVVRYIGRYTHRVAISNQRIIDVNNGRVLFRYKDYKASRFTWKEMDLSASEFIRRFLSHVLPKGFHKIRHYGFLANGRCKKMVSHIRGVLHCDTVDKNNTKSEKTHKQCPECKKGRMVPWFIKDGFGRIVCLSNIKMNCGVLPDTS
ncbi:MAG: IS91 family transposase [Desulfobacterales bacterium]|nr:IS91 family transposase [Desulfobacterales bacterium]MDD4071669.1 IS91 family transposase [Desulfobacterales bacterium]MDD4393580.1 IS91 family transposase [Desulfobacterales bacterium]